MSDISVMIEHCMFAVAQKQEKYHAPVSFIQMRRLLFPVSHETGKAADRQRRDIHTAVLCAVETGFLTYDAGKAAFKTVTPNGHPFYKSFSPDATFCLTEKGWDFAPYISADEIKLEDLRTAYK